VLPEVGRGDGMDRDRPPDTFEIPVLFFGATCSPTSAQYVKDRNALEFKNEFPEAVKAITECHYVDDYLGCTDSVDDGIKLTKEVQKRGGFYICNWTSNCREVLGSLTEEFRANDVKELKLCEDLPTGRVLGLSWDPEADVFIWKYNFNKVPSGVVTGEKIPTKREILGLMMSAYDPLGFLEYLTVKAKIILQDI
jgi:hypothetical protein